MERAPEISVVIAARDMMPFISETLLSLSAQTIDSWEVIVVDDGSTDGTGALVDALAASDSRVDVVAGPCRGVSVARNLGCSRVRSPVVLFLDGDDLLAADALERALVALQNAPLAPAAVGGVIRITEAGAPLPGRDNRELAPASDTLSALLAKNIVVNGGALAIRRAAIAEAGPYTEGLVHGEDWEFWCRLAELGDFAVVPGAPMLHWRQRAGGANYRARTGAFARRVPCLEALSQRPSLQQRFGSRLRRLLRARQIDIFWAGVRSELQYGSAWRAIGIGLVGLVIYPGSFARPRLALRLLKSLGR